MRVYGKAWSGTNTNDNSTSERVGLRMDARGLTRAPTSAHAYKTRFGHAGLLRHSDQDSPLDRVEELPGPERIRPTFASPLGTLALHMASDEPC